MSRYELRACHDWGDGKVDSHPVNHWLPEAPHFFGIYENMSDGRQEHVLDFGSLAKADEICQWLNQMPDGIRLAPDLLQIEKED